MSVHFSKAYYIVVSGHEEKDLIRASVDARKNSYSPFSKFAVGAALKCEDGTIVTGCNVENSSYGLSICAERSAIVKAVSDGYRRFTSIAVCAALPNDMFTAPCGACRQFISEFSNKKDIIIYLTRPDMKKVVVTSIRELLPFSFQLDSLQ
ncbi:cytidine deaminase-like [Nilaparvata lugens]|uniref:cytidine deaminase-like n=1 Tax=Nilaparvata lugens TaxID=108931 RepID=UPI00193D8103|nr:cytidine deaminase-like [Nilaparvata lugens]